MKLINVERLYRDALFHLLAKGYSRNDVCVRFAIKLLMSVKNRRKRDLTILQ